MNRKANSGSFKKGHKTWNKGVPMRPETRAKVMRTNYQKGNVPHHTRPVGSTRLNREGMIMVKLPGPDPSRPAVGRWVLKHKWLWEKVNGPVPKGWVLKCMSKDRQNCAPSNWEAVCRGVNARLQVMGFEDAPLEVRQTMLAEARLRQRIGEIQPSNAQKWIARKKAKASA